MRSSTSAGSSPSERIDGFPIDPVLERWDRSPDLAAHGVSFLLYGLLDVVVDGYFDAVQAFDDYYDEVSEGIFSERPLDPAEQRHWFQMRRAHGPLPPPRRPDARSGQQPHATRTRGRLRASCTPTTRTSTTTSCASASPPTRFATSSSTIVETNISLRDYRQNQIVKKVSSWAAIIAVPALITGYYGMNVPYPGSGSTWGVIASTALIVVLSAGLYLIFRHRDWL